MTRDRSGFPPNWDIDETKTGFFRTHSCGGCNSGEKPCPRGGPHNCEHPHARND
jgi:hypothetical protein